MFEEHGEAEQQQHVRRYDVPQCNAGEQSLQKRRYGLEPMVRPQCKLYRVHLCRGLTDAAGDCLGR